MLHHAKRYMRTVEVSSNHHLLIHSPHLQYSHTDQSNTFIHLLYTLKLLIIIMQFTTTLVACLGAMVAGASAQGGWGSSAAPAYGSSAAPVSSTAPAAYSSSPASSAAGYSSASPSSAPAPYSSTSAPVPAPYPTTSAPTTWGPAPTGGMPGNGTYTHGGGLTTSKSTTAPAPSQTYVVPSTGGAAQIGGSVLGLLIAGGIALVSSSYYLYLALC
jgi:hypothetical protein